TKLAFSRCGCAYSSVAACVEENVADLRLGKLARLRKRGVLLPGLPHESLCGGANWPAHPASEEAAATATQNARGAVAKRDCGQSGFRICNLHDGQPRLVLRSWRRHFVRARNLKILRAQISKDVFARHNT